MNEHSHLRNLINLGFIVDEKVIDKIESLNEEEFFRLVEDLKKESAFLIDEEILKNLLASDVKILNFFKKAESFAIHDIVKTLNNRYNFLQDILLKKVELSNIVSINKCSNGNVSVIGLIKDKEEKIDNYIISLEDPTGEIQVSLGKKIGEKIALDDVVAVSGKFSNKILVADKILFPDVPLRPVSYSKEPAKVAFTDKNVKADYQIYNNKIRDNIKNKEYEITNPCIFKINDVIFLIVLDFDPLEVLKKRYVSIEDNDFLISPNPDIVLTNKEINTNYKGISVVSKNRLIDLKTREIKNV